MQLQFWRLAFWRGLAGAALIVFVAPALAAGNWELGKNQFHDNCTACHNDFGGSDPLQAFPLGQSAATVQGKIDSGMRGTLFGNPDPLKTSDNSINDTVSNIAAYLGKPTFPLASLGSTGITFDPVSVELTRTQTVRLSNTGSANLVVGSVNLSDTLNYSVDASACTTVGHAAGANFCDIVVTFRPQSAAAFNNRTLTISHNTFGGSSTLTLSGTGQTQFDVASALLTFTPATAPTGTLQMTITDRKGDRIQVCRVDAPTFSFPADFTLEAPFALGPDGCFTSTAAAAPPRTFNVGVHFAAGDIGPRNANLSVQRVDAGGAALGNRTTVQLQGNPGPLATVNASSLFDAAIDPGVEIDSDSVLERSFTLFSKGSQPLVFSGTSFVISGPNPRDYALAGTGCQTLAGLPAFLASTAPSCLLTLRFNPSGVGRRPAALTLRFAGTADNAVTLDGLGIRGPRLAVQRAGLPLASGDDLQFGAQTIGGLYPAIRVTLVNGGTLGDLEIVLPAADALPGFAFVAGAGCARLAPAAECALDVRFDPATVQPHSAALPVRTRASGSGESFKEFTLDLLGQGTAAAVPVLAWTDTTGMPIGQLAFADTDAGAPRTSRIRLRNIGPGGVTLQLANVIGLDGTNFGLDSSDCASGRDLFENTSCELAVQFAPGTAGLKSASIQLAAKVGTPPLLVLAPLLPASGTAIASATAATLLLSATTLQFDTTVVGAAARPLELRLSNTGSRSLRVLGLDAAAPFVVHPDSCTQLPITLPPGHDCTLTLSFHPQAQGDLAGLLRIISDTVPQVQEVALTGRGDAPADYSSGGCSIAAGDTLLDPTLWMLVLLAAIVLRLRRARRRRG